VRSLEFHPDAQDEFISAVQFYESQTAGLGLDFILTIQRTYERLDEFPATGAPFGRRLRRLLVPKFPYGLLYRVEPELRCSGPGARACSPSAAERGRYPPQNASAMIRVRAIDHLVLRVADLDKMLRFYSEALGCAIERRQDAIGLVQLRAGGSLIDLVPVDGKLGRVGGAAPGPEGRNMDHFCLRVEPFDEGAIRSQLAKYGYSAGPLARRYGAEGDGPSIYVTDPEGNVVELKGPPGERSGG
jgi:catechol 2,3-dioxygenase-like lactoylglutathione lyase family enzyme